MLARVSHFLVASCALAAMATTGCGQDAVLQPTTPAGDARRDPLPPSRPFYMGFTPWPYDFSEQAQRDTYRTLRQYGDLVLFHLDTGVPWPEALVNAPYHANLQAELAVMREQAQHFSKVYVSATPQAQDRATLAKYWSVDQHQELPANWKHRTFDDPQVIQAYTSYCRFLIKYFQPDYFAYGIEVNGSLSPRHANYVPFLKFVEAVYRTLKQEYPDLPIFLTFQTGSFEMSWEEQWQVNRALIAFSDLVGMSTYPFWVPNHLQPKAANMEYLPRDWFARMARLAPNKAFAVTETGYIAEDFRLGRVAIQGTAEWQARYVDFLLRQAHDLRAEFVVWFVARDYDRGCETLNKLGVTLEGAEIWRDTGLLDGEGRPRPGLHIWERWRALPRERSRSPLETGGQSNENG